MSTLIAGQSRSDVSDVLKRGAKLVEAGRLAAAQELYENGLLRATDDPDLRFELGMVYFQQQNWPKAVENFTNSIRTRPGIVKPLFYLAEAYFMESDLARARETIAQAAAIAPNDPQICQKYGEYLTATLETRAEGLSWLMKARSLYPGLKRIDFEIGKAQFELTDYQSAVSSLGAALKKDPADGEAAFYLAESHANFGDWEEARKDYALALTRGYSSGAPYYGLGRALVELGEFQAAIEPLRRASVLQPALIKAHFQLGRAYRQLGLTKNAQHENELFNVLNDRVDTANELAGPEEEQAWKQVRPLLEAGKEGEALQLLAKLPVAKLLGHGEPHYLLGAMYYSLGRKADAERMLKTARANAPKAAHFAAYLGMVQLSSGETAAAEESFHDALEFGSGEALALIGMGSIQYQKQHWAAAADYLEKSRTADPGALLMLCDAYFRIGRDNDALLAADAIRILAVDRKSLIDELDRLLTRRQSNESRVTP
ncbi:MAG: tetratricopeptide repeat protein [Acidobacteriia bacterium]|nr:tetratricopeptide repeat protein [Terriglobia bacterium]